MLHCCLCCLTLLLLAETQLVQEPPHILQAQLLYGMHDGASGWPEISSHPRGGCIVRISGLAGQVRS